MNDLNGPVFYQGKYHLFYQHNPYSCVWDHMHWGHAVSEDLVHWEHLPIALAPDERGDFFSGSAVVDTEGISGFGSKENPALLLYYTSHHPQTLREEQCMAVSTDGITFTKFEANPIIAGKEHTPARDPHVFRNEVFGGYSMCITTEKSVEYYHSSDLIHWEKTGEFTLPSYAFQGMIECPCMVDFSFEGQPQYVLMVSMVIPESEYGKFPEHVKPHNCLMQYLVGDFDGKAFVPDSSQSEALLVEESPNFYAGTVFANTKE
ncbi:MAG: glycoside hydrolase family 32 protein [Lachnospiraceae bacterium]|nr:glycoside hydrolase family 32 protein [Lachnospiraceae bacterium]